MPFDYQQIDNLEDEVDALVSPDTEEVLAKSKDYDSGIVAASALRIALEAAATPGGSVALDDLTDVDTAGGAEGDVLTQQNDGSFALEAPSGGSQPWDEQTVGALVTDWTDDGNGTWAFVAGVISQTDATADSKLIHNTPLPSTIYVLEAEVRIPLGQDAGVTVQVVLSDRNQSDTGNPGTSELLGEGVALIADAMGDGAGFQLATWVDAGANHYPPGGWPTAIAQGEWHTLRVVSTPGYQYSYLDGVYVTADEVISGGNDSQPGTPTRPDRIGLGAIGLVDFRNVKLWTHALPA